MAAILKFKMAAEDTLEKNGSNSAFVHWSIKKVKSIGSTSIANFALDYITPCTKDEKWLNPTQKDARSLAHKSAHLRFSYLDGWWYIWVNGAEMGDYMCIT